MHGQPRPSGRAKLLLAGGTLGLMAGSLGYSIPSAHAATGNTYYVGTAVDDAGSVAAATCESATNTTCSLRDAVANANADGASLTDTILFESALTGKTLTVTGSAIPVSDAGPLTITGAGAGKTILDGGRSTLILDVSGAAVTLSGMTLQNGANSSSSVGGGAIENTGTLSLTNVDIMHNVAYDNGGGIDSSGTLTISGGSISGNTSQDNCGGGLNLGGGTATVDSVTLDGNSSDCGGGVQVRGGATFTLTNSTVSGNYSRDYDDGGGIVNGWYGGTGATSTLTNNTIVNNTSAEYGGGVANESTSKITLVNNTIAGNNALQGGGGIYNDNRTAGSFVLQGNILAANIEYGSQTNQCLGYGQITSKGYNVVGPEADAACTFGPNDLLNSDAKLLSLADNGGPTMTEALASGSPALHVEPKALCPATDQRGVSRPQPANSATCDAGAFELNIAPPVPGYWTVASDGGVFAFHAPFLGSTGGIKLASPVVGMAADALTGGYRLVAADGGVFSYKARFFGSAAGHKLSSPIVGIATDPLTGGYWLVGQDGGVFGYNAPFYGSAFGKTTAPIVGITADPSTGGYWLVGQDGNVYPFHAPSYGSTVGKKLNAPVVGMAADPATGGYWLVASDGGIFNFHAPLWGSLGAVKLAKPVVGIVADPSTDGYWLVASDGGIFAYHAPFLGSTGGVNLASPMVGIAAVPVS